MANSVAGFKPVAHQGWTIEAGGDGSVRAGRKLRRVLSLLLSLAISVVLVFCVELISRGSLESTWLFLADSLRPGWSTVAIFALVFVAVDGLLGRAQQATLLLGPLVLLLAATSMQKAHYLGDPLYPADFLYGWQIVDLLPLLVRDRPFTAAAIAVAIIAGTALLVAGWIWSRRNLRAISRRERLTRLAVTLPALAFIASIMDYATFSWTRDRLQIIPMMWDQKENYAFNGFTLGFALNVPMANVAAPAGYSAETMSAITRPGVPVATLPGEKPDIIIVMSESFWDPTRLPNVTITPDPIPSVRALQSGHMFSPEFGGMTANVEFEALTGFSNAFLPYGSIPYQQYVRGPVPSLATFLNSEGYETRALHPFGGWFWNRKPVYSEFGFQSFMSEETLPLLAKRGPLVSDAAFMDEIIREADQIRDPFFFFAVTLQSHGPYEPNRYRDTTHSVESRTSDRARDSILTYAEGASDADKSLQRLIDWAKLRKRPTIIAFFGDHLPPLGPVYVETGFMKEPVAARKGSLKTMSVQHETPLVIWSNKTGPVKDLGAISPSFIPLHVLKTAGIEHPYYTGFLGELSERYRVVDRNLLVSADNKPTAEWARQPEVDPAVHDFRLLQYDMMFGSQFATDAYFPELNPVAISGDSMIGYLGFR